jgi:hypothetical protein
VTAIEPRDPDPEFRIGALKWLSDHTAKRYQAARSELARTVKRGAHLPGCSPLDDRQLAMVYMSDPDWWTVITDQAELTDWYAQHYPDHTEQTQEITGPADEVLAVVQAYAPHLVSTTTRICDWALQELRTVSAANRTPTGPGGEMDVPGVEVVQPNPTLTVRLARDADDVMADLLARNLLTVDGQMRELEA